MVAARAATAVAAFSLGAWVVVLQLDGPMDGGLGSPLWFVGLWMTMTAAMMLPSALPMLLVVSATGGRATAFAAGYVVAWTAFGGAMYVLAQAAGGVMPHATGAALVAAGAYQLTPLKHACLRRCRSPLAFLHRHARPGVAGAAYTGAAHGVFCIGCCAGLMIVLFAVGVMSLAWMLVVTAVVLAEKAAPRGDRLVPATAVALAAAGVWAIL